nr:MAG TPA: hypothetical protein [Caudoviricetes sp.]
MLVPFYLCLQKFFYNFFFNFSIQYLLFSLFYMYNFSSIYPKFILYISCPANKIDIDKNWN